jgi:hypothetical protein
MAAKYRHEKKRMQEFAWEFASLVLSAASPTGRKGGGILWSPACMKRP